MTAPEDCLSFGALEKICSGETQESPILQILGYKLVPGSNDSRYRLLLNDGVTLFPFAILATQLNALIHSKCLEKYTIFKLKNYACSQIMSSKQIIICLDIEILFSGSEVNKKIDKNNCSPIQNTNVNESTSQSVFPTQNDIFITCKSQPSTSQSVISGHQSNIGRSSFSFESFTNIKEENIENSDNETYVPPTQNNVLLNQEPQPSTSRVNQSSNSAHSNKGRSSFSFVPFKNIKEENLENSDGQISTLSNILPDPEPQPSTSYAIQNWDTMQSSTGGSPTIQFSCISSLSPYRNKWRIKARVFYKTPMFTYNNTRKQGKYFSVNLLDETGEIRATAFDDNAERLYDLMENFKVYVISNASISLARRNSDVKNEFEIIFGRNTKIEPCIDDQALPMPTFNFRAIPTITTLLKDSCVDVIGICSQISDASLMAVRYTDMLKREMLLIDQSKIPLPVTLWGSHAENCAIVENCVVAIKNAKVSYFRGRSLNVNRTSMIYVNPDTNKAAELRSWYQSLDSSESQSMASTNSAQTASQNWKTLGDVFALNTESNLNRTLYHTTKATVSMVKKENVLYKACSTAACWKKVNELDNGLYKCPKCDIDLDTFNWMLALKVQLADFTGSQWATAFGGNAEDLIGLSANQLYQLKMENENRYLELLGQLELKSFIFKIRSHFEKYDDDIQLKSVILSYSPVEFGTYTRKVLANISRLSRILNSQ